VPGRIALPEEETIGVAFDRGAKEPRERGIMRRKRLRGAIAQAAGDLLADDAWGGLGDGAERGTVRHAGFEKKVLSTYSSVVHRDA